MNIYEIPFTRENGTTGSDRFVAPNEAQARRDFKEVYCHSTGYGSITGVELVSSDATATKEQEHEALKKIRKIVEELGSDSYIATAFAGCFEIAESNIENDFADSMKDRWLSADRKLNEANGTIEELRDKLAESEKDYEAAHTAAHQVADEKDAEIAALKSELTNAIETGKHNGRMCEEARSDIAEYQRRAEEAEAEVIRLKAKLYDYIVAGA